MPDSDKNNNDLLKYTEDVADRAAQDPGTSFTIAATPAQGNLRTTAGGSSAQASSSEMGNDETQLKNVHGAVDTITDPEQISNGASELPVLSVPAAQQDARIGNTGEVVSQINGQGHQTISSDYDPKFTGVDNNLKPIIISNVANRFVR